MPKLKGCSEQSIQLQGYAKASVFLKECNPIVLSRKYANVRTAKEALEITNVCLSHIAEAYGDATLKVFVKTHLALLQKYLNVKDDMLLDSSIVEELSLYIIEDCIDFSMAEFTLVFRKIKKGEYGLIYGRVDPVFILQSFSKYNDTERKEAKKALYRPQVEKMKIEFSQAYFDGAANILMKTFKDESELKIHLMKWKGFLCERCISSKVRDCQQTAKLFVDIELEKEQPSLFALSSWLLSWNVEI